jgi:hypothetical protein
MFEKEKKTLTQKTKIRTQDHALHHRWWPPKRQTWQRFEPMTMHYTIDDPRKDKYSNPRHALHHHWLPQSQSFELRTMHYTTIDPRPKRQRFEPTTMHYTTIDPPKVKDSNSRHALHHHWPPQSQSSNPRPCTTPLLMSPKRQRFEPKTMHY